MAARGMRVQFVDCRWELGHPERGRELYRAGHVPGASFLDVEGELAAPPGGAEGGRHPLPADEDFRRAAEAAGIGDDALVVAYDQGMNGGAARLWWLLRHFGHDDVAVLEGGLEHWLGPLRAGDEPVERGELTLMPRSDDVLSGREIEARLGEPGFLVVDARLPERFRGESEPIDAVAGHIPGAVNAPYVEGELPPVDPETVDEVVAYCGSGITACVTVLRLERAGVQAKLYPGSWSEWSSRGLAVERG
jgi:thiosulfate/3-mercaptopyruvate sulfurtransferase